MVYVGQKDCGLCGIDEGAHGLHGVEERACDLHGVEEGATVYMM